MIRVKLDENLGRSHAEMLIEAGHAAERLHEQGMSGASDSEVWRHVCQHGYFFITLDHDFADVRRFAPGTHPGLLLLRPRSRSRDAIAGLLRQVFDRHRLVDLEGCLVVADEAKTRIRRA